jgi:glycosyltransferase involved in cell wall biosynthesis
MKVLFQSRTNLYSAPGGDLVQMLKTKEFLEKKGVIIDISLQFDENLQNYDIVHVFNLMEPQEIYLYVENAKKQNKPVALSTIYGLYTEFERKARGGLFQMVANVLSPYQIGYIKTFVRHYKEKRMHKGVHLMLRKGYYGLMKEIANNTDVFLPNSESEMHRVAHEFKLKDYNYVNVSNAVDISIFDKKHEENKQNPFEKYSGCVLCAARIEGRKSTLNLIRAIKKTPYQLVLVGKESHNQKSYIDAVHNEANEQVHFLGILPHDQLADLYAVAKVHALVSWMETPGLSSLEAAVMDCNLVITRKGDTYDYFADDAFYCEPDDVDSIKDAIIKAYDAPLNQNLKQRILDNYTWENTANQTFDAYQLALKKI